MEVFLIVERKEMEMREGADEGKDDTAVDPLMFVVFLPHEID